MNKRGIGEMAFNYSPGIVPRDPDELIRFLEDELQQLRAIIDILVQGHFDRTDVAPSKPREGDVRYASGAAGSWNPGHGKGIYYFDGTSWVSITDRDNDTWD